MLALGLERGTSSFEYLASHLTFGSLALLKLESELCTHVERSGVFVCVEYQEIFFRGTQSKAFFIGGSAITIQK